MPERQQCRHRLNELLRAEYACAGQLQSVLQTEAEALLARDVDKLEHLVGEKHRLMQNFEQMEVDLRQLLSTTGFHAEQPDVEACIAWCDDSGQLLRGWNLLLERVRNCQQQNRSNGVTLEASRRHAQQVLGILRGQSPQPDLYSPTGTSSHATDSGRSLATA